MAEQDLWSDIEKYKNGVIKNTKQTININGKTLKINLDDPNVKQYYKGWRHGTASELLEFSEFALRHGRIPTLDEWNTHVGNNENAENEYANLSAAFRQVATDNDIQYNTATGEIVQSGDSKINALNEYYHDLYSLDEGTTGRRTYDTMLGTHQQQALDAQALADAQMQKAALQQAQTVKAITDQVKAERMAKLRAGMSETQIANDDMQSMMININALNQQATEMNTARLQAQQAYDNAQYAAYQDWINASQAQGQTAAAMAASDAGDAYIQTLKRMRQTNETYANASRAVTGMDK